MGESSCCSRQGCSSHVPDSAACTAVDNCNPDFVWITVIQTSYLHLRPARTGPSRSRPHADCPQTTQGHGMFSPQALRLGQGTGITERNKLGIECRAMGQDSIVQARGKSIYTCFVAVTHIGKSICGVGVLGKGHFVFRGHCCLCKCQEVCGSRDQHIYGFQGQVLSCCYWWSFSSGQGPLA